MNGSPSDGNVGWPNSLDEMELMGRPRQQPPPASASANDPSTADRSLPDGKMTARDNDTCNNNITSETMEEIGGATIILGQDPRKTVRRKLRSIHHFVGLPFVLVCELYSMMITINGTLGTGLYVRSGQILELGGPVAVVVSFLLVGFLAWAVMQCITELLCLWPVPGALPLFVRKFVDKELGIAVGVAYWFTYSIGFSALIASAASNLNYWTAGIQGFTVGVVYVTLPVVLVVINTLEVEIYGWFEVVTGGIKISFLVAIVMSLIAIYSKNGISYDSVESWNGTLEYDDHAASGWTEALLMSLSIATFAYAGVEIIAASAIEARWPSPSETSETSRAIPQAQTSRSSSSQTNEAQHSPRRTEEAQRSIGSTIKFTSVFAPLVVAAAYTISGLLVSFGLGRADCELPRLSWIGSGECEQDVNTGARNFTSSPFVLVAQRSKIPGLDQAFNAFIVFTALTCANTNLYVASRTMFGLTRNIRGRGFIPRCLYWFGKTDRNKVPLRAMLFSALAFCWVPFLQEGGGFDTDTALGKFVEILSQMGSVSVLIVWTCQCLVYIRYYSCIHKHRHALEQEGIYLVENRKQESGDYLYRSHWQPALAYVAFIGCIAVLVVCNGAFLWKKFHFFPFLSAYITVIVFFAIWAGLKFYNRAPWSFIDLNETAVKELMGHLYELRAASMEQPEDDSEPWWATFRRIFRVRRRSS